MTKKRAKELSKVTKELIDILSDGADYRGAYTAEIDDGSRNYESQLQLDIPLNLSTPMQLIDFVATEAFARGVNIGKERLQEDIRALLGKL